MGPELFRFPAKEFAYITSDTVNQMNLATVSLSGRNLFYWKPFMKRGRNSPTELTTLSAVGLVIVCHHESKAEGGDWGF